MKDQCKDLAEICFAYIDGGLSEEDFRKVTERMDKYEYCRHCIETLGLTRDSIGKLKKDDMPESMKDKLKACLREKREGG